MFQSSPALSGRCNIIKPEGIDTSRFVSILTGPFGPVQPHHLPGGGEVVGVSILTGPFGPVQPISTSGICIRLEVSILTGPFGPVQLSRRA